MLLGPAPHPPARGLGGDPPWAMKALLALMAQGVITRSMGDSRCWQTRGRTPSVVNGATAAKRSRPGIGRPSPARRLPRRARGVTVGMDAGAALAGRCKRRDGRSEAVRCPVTARRHHALPHRLRRLRSITVPPPSCSRHHSPLLFSCAPAAPDASRCGSP